MDKAILTKIPKGGSIYVDGSQYCDPTPIEMPLGYQVPESLESMIARMCTDRVMQMELARQNSGQDSEEEADDFEVDGDDDLDFQDAGHQMTEMQEEYVDLKKLREDSELHAEREIAERVEQEKSKKKRKVRVDKEDSAESIEGDGTVNT
ncbi:MAG: hypothetical protein [Microviridae sp.]|nr:MAG: hypothetical protein [Microviridae sp.]